VVTTTRCQGIGEKTKMRRIVKDLKFHVFNAGAITGTLYAMFAFHFPHPYQTICTFVLCLLCSLGVIKLCISRRKKEEKQKSKPRSE